MTHKTINHTAGPLAALHRACAKGEPIVEVSVEQAKTKKLQAQFICPIWAVWFGQSVNLYFTRYHCEQFTWALRLNGTANSRRSTRRQSGGRVLKPRAKKASPRGIDWTPKGAVHPPRSLFTLLPIVSGHGMERCGLGTGDYEGVLFDPWRKGDLVAIEYRRSAWHQGKGHSQYTTWYIGRRASTPSHVRHAYDIGGISPLYSHQNIKLFRHRLQVSPTSLTS